MKNILSGPEGKVAFEMIDRRAGTIANLFSLANRDNCQVVATVAHRKTDNAYCVRINDICYQGNLLNIGVRPLYGECNIFG